MTDYFRDIEEIEALVRARRRQLALAQALGQPMPMLETEPLPKSLTRFLDGSHEHVIEDD